MKVLIDDKIPYIRAAAEWLLGDVCYLPGHAFAGSRALREADALIIRTRTHVDAALLRDTNVKFVATATIGYDHIDTDYLRASHIAWTNCPGCNATSVAQYVRNSILTTPLAPLKGGITPSPFRGIEGVFPSLTVGIVGYGHVGRAVRHALEAIGCRILINDPPLGEGVPLSTLARECDVITFHTPLTTGGKYPTYHLADEQFFASLRRKPVIINAARGGVVDEAALLRAYADGRVSQMFIDTWEGEPTINLELLEKAFIATPHIAGYSADGKSNASRMALRAICAHFRVPIPDEARFLALTAPPALQHSTSDVQCSTFNPLSLYNPLDDSRRLKSAPQDFEYQRGNYPLRRESL